MGIHRQKSMAVVYEAWGSQRSEMLNSTPEPMVFWHCPDTVGLPPPPIIVTIKGESDHFVYMPYDTMALNGSQQLDIGGVNAAADDNHFRASYPSEHQAAMDRMEAHCAMRRMPASSSAEDRYHVSPAASPEASFAPSRLAPPTYAQAPEQPHTWLTDYPGEYYGEGADYKTTVLQPHGLPNLSIPSVDPWGYANGMAAMSIDSLEYNAHTGLSNFTNGTFSSTYNGSNTSSTYCVGGSFSSTFSSTLGDNLPVPDAFPPRVFHNSTPVDSYDNGGRVQELPASLHSPENYSTRSYSLSSASSPAAVESGATPSSSGPLAPGSAQPRKKTSAKGRRKLPDKQARGRHTGRGSSPPTKSAARGRSRAIASQGSSFTIPRRHSKSTRSNTSTVTTLIAKQSDVETQPEQIQLEPTVVRQAHLRPVLPAPSPRLALPSSPSPPHRQLTEKDELLVQYKEAGMGYKEIKQLGGFSEAVSTLRGRYRTITKPKEARVRKPAWTDRDLRLLEQGVRSFTSGSDLRTAKIPWMRVAAYIKDNGGYHFGNSTCRKRWDEFFASEVAAGKDPARPFYEQW